MQIEQMTLLPPGDFVRVADAITTLGVSLVLWAKIIDETDPNEAYSVFSSMKDDMLAHSEVCHCMLQAYPKIFKAMKFQLPDGMSVTTVENPLFHPDIAEAEAKASANDEADEWLNPF